MRLSGMGNRKCWVKGRKGLDFAGELRHGGAVCVPGRCRADRMAVRVLRCSEQHGMFMAARSASYALADFSIRLVLGHIGKVIWSEPRLHFGHRVPIGIAHLTFNVNTTAKQLCLRIALSVRVRRFQQPTCRNSSVQSVLWTGRRRRTTSSRRRLAGGRRNPSLQTLVSAMACWQVPA